jgi:hypothetical protein
MEAQGRPVIKTIVLGWVLNTQTLTVHLTDDKFRLWTKELVDITTNSKQSVTAKSLECLLGRLQHAATIFKPGKHFLSRLYSAHQRALKTRFTRLSRSELEDLKLWQTFLAKTMDGISMNLVIPQEPSIILLTDASTTKGLGGYNVHTGKSWRLPLQPWMVGMSINTLEFMSAIIAFEIDVLDLPPTNFECYLIATDNTAAMGWLQKSNFDVDGEQGVQLTLARHLASRLLELNVCISSQWLAGVHNKVADMLSREQEMSNIEITKLILSSYPQQVPLSFNTSQCPDSICSLVYSLARPWLPEIALQTPPIQEKRLIGNDGKNSWQSLPLQTPTCLPSPVPNESPFFQLTSNVSEPSNCSPF